MDHLSSQGFLTVDENLDIQMSSASACLVMKLRNNSEHESISAVITSRDCDSRAMFLCSFDVFQNTKLEKKKKFSCLQPNRTSSTNDLKEEKRRKRYTAIERGEQAGANKSSK